MNTKTDLFSKRNLRFAVVFVLVVLAAGIYFLFRPFPGGPGISAQANEPKASGLEVAGANNWNAVVNASSAPDSFTASSLRDFQRYNSGGTVQDSQGNQITAPDTVASVLASAPSEVQRHYGAGDEYENTSQSNPITALSSISGSQRHYGAGDEFENDSLGDRIVAPSEAEAARAYPPTGARSLYISNGYILEKDAQGSRIIAPSSEMYTFKVTKSNRYETP
jgi:hypothetical protein